jgi:hypothetical protein
LRGYTKEAERLLNESREVERFTLEPNAWLEAFGVRDLAEQERINKRVIERISALEARADRRRIRENKRTIGRERLEKQAIDLSYRPDRNGVKTWCLSDRRSIRIAFIKTLKKLMKEARQVLTLWRTGDMSVKYPPGLYPPSMPKLANMISP